MTYDNLKIYDTVTVVGRGLILLLNLKDNGFGEDDVIYESPISVDDIVIYQDKHYLVRGVESSRILSGISPHIGLNVRETE